MQFNRYLADIRVQVREAMQAGQVLCRISTRATVSPYSVRKYLDGSNNMYQTM